jgi:DNA polymerase-1
LIENKKSSGGTYGLLMLVDGNSIVNRAYYAFAGQSRLVTKNGFPTRAIFGFLNIFYKYFDEINPTHVCVAFDMPGPTFRHKEYDQYKAGRKGMPEDLARQLPVLKEVIHALGWRMAECEGYEADDILGALSAESEHEGIKCVIVTGDRDTLQLISPTTRVLLPVTRAGQTRTEEFDENALRAKYGVSPELFIDLKGLMGDSSDNIPGVPGIGEKTAIELVGKLGGIDDIYANLEAVDRKSVRAKLESGKESAYLSRRLATIVRDVPCGLKLRDLELTAPNRGDLYKLFTELQFQSYILKMGLTPLDLTVETFEARDVFDPAITGSQSGDGESGASSGRPVCIIDGITAFYDMVKKLGESGHSENGETGFVFFPIFEKTSRFNQVLFGAACLCRGGVYYFETEDGFAIRKNHTAPVVETGTVTPGYSAVPSAYAVPIRDVFDAFRPLLNNSGVGISGHDVKQINRWLLANNEKCPVYDFDTMLGAYAADAASGAYGLPEITMTYTGRALTDIDEMRGRGKSRKSLPDFTSPELANTAAACAEAIRDVIPALKAEITANGQEDLYYGVELPLSEVLASMEVKGFYVDVGGLREFSAELDKFIEGLTEQIYEMAGGSFNINSTKQLGVLLYDKLGLKPVKKTKTGYSTDADALMDLAGKHPIIDKISDYRQHVKLRSTYTDGLIELINPADGRIHTTMNQAVTATGRISSTEPNLQNIPVRLALGSEIRRLFVPEGEGVVLLGADYSQIELRVLAHLSEDEGLAEAFRDGVDIHRSTASRVFNVSEADVTDEMRTRAKAVNFGIVYGIGDFSLARDIGTTRKEAREYIDGYLDKYEGVRRYMKDAVEQSRKTGYTQTLLHRRRSLPELKASNFNTRAFGERVAMNTPVQGSAADIIKIAMVRVYNELKSKNFKSKLILQVHDELIIEAHADELDAAARILRASMERAISLSVPLVADVYYGNNWKDIKTHKI